jgi:hypothetical protein
MEAKGWTRRGPTEEEAPWVLAEEALESADREELVPDMGAAGS